MGKSWENVETNGKMWGNTQGIYDGNMMEPSGKDCKSVWKL